MKYSKTKLFCVMVGIILVLTMVAGAVSVRGSNLIKSIGEVDSGELPSGAMSKIVKSISADASPDELITKTYPKDILLYLGIDNNGEILNLNASPRALTAINELYPMECIRQIDDDLLYAVYRLEDEGKTFNAYLFFEKVEPVEEASRGDSEVWWLTGRVLFSEKSLSTDDFATISVGSTMRDVSDIDPLTLEFAPEDTGPITVQEYDFDLDDYVERTYVPDPVLDYKDYHLLTDGIMCITYTRPDAESEFVVSSIGVNSTFEIDSTYSRGTVCQEVAPGDYPE